VAALLIHVAPTRGCVDDLLSAYPAYRFSACKSGAASAKVAQHNVVGVEFVGVRENPCAAAGACLTAIDVMHGRADHVVPHNVLWRGPASVVCHGQL